jgi:cobalt-zinc-cadmium efflux system protein
MPGGHPGDVFIHRLAEELSVKFRINHATVQIEIDQHCACALAPDDVV